VEPWAARFGESRTCRRAELRRCAGLCAFLVVLCVLCVSILISKQTKSPLIRHDFSTQRTPTTKNAQRRECGRAVPIPGDRSAQGAAVRMV
jgi:hypothetical protein